MEKRKEKIIVQDTKSFYQVPSKAMNATEVFLIDKIQVEAYRDTDLFNGCQTVAGIIVYALHLAGDDGVKLWKNASYFQKDEPNIIVNKSQTSLSAYQYNRKE